MLRSNTIRKIQQLLDELDVKKDGVIVLSLAEGIAKGDIKQILEIFIDRTEQGTLCLVGDCSFNTVKSNLDELSDFTEKERLNIFTSKDIKILSLLDDIYLSAHPSLEIACIGKEASFLTRHKALDFPYGETSLFNDLYNLDATYVVVGDIDNLYPLKFASAKDDMIVKRNVCLYQNKELSYLDFEFDFNLAQSQFKQLALQVQGAYGIRYRQIIDILRNV